MFTHEYVPCKPLFSPKTHKITEDIYFIYLDEQ